MLNFSLLYYYVYFSLLFDYDKGGEDVYKCVVLEFFNAGGVLYVIISKTIWGV
jgi:hypothetical protein